jgi:hypothetical protein
MGLAHSTVELAGKTLVDAEVCRALWFILMLDFT